MQKLWSARGRGPKDPQTLFDVIWLDPNEELTPDAEWRFLRLHVETAIALQIGLATGEFRSGRYVRGGQSLDRRPPDSEDGLAPTSSQGR